ncbi:flagellar biosynthesis protein FlhB [Ketobacter sp. MCCC 1A13808]|uniref:flagellar biosynthesis protein FlhB n=1 Tax=Ketobacter sp. MCCC 1A13808 TaxID=2602738 RepID=UPI0012EC40AA|nr:flagellar biosynthesis protein FlhB [Ketobacter sp. MCCC 1A13808]MVF10903.1 flagellar biosynthesis protein FlhB [Ketobacter sp. MCCC 1A13808]
MAENEDGQEKTEDATAKKEQEAKEKGQVARSKELGSVAVTMCGAAGIIMSGSMLYDIGREVFELNYQIPRDELMSPDVMSGNLIASAKLAFSALVPFYILVFAAALFVPPLVGGFNFSTKALAPKFNKLNPFSGLKRMFSVQALMEMTKAIAKFLLVGTFAILIMQYDWDRYLALGFQPVDEAMTSGVILVAWAFFYLCCSLLLIAAIDVPFQIYQHKKQLKMTKQEVKDEYKDTEGKPEVKGKIRQKQREMAQSRMMSAIPEADVVITNPTHYAVALKYDSKKMLAPILVAKGADFVALQIKKVALANDVIILNSPPLARSIYYHSELDREIPQGLYVSVAQVLAYVFQLEQFQQGKGPNPGTTPDFVVPEDMRKDE